MRDYLLTLNTAYLTTRTLARRFREGDGDAFWTLLHSNTVYIKEHLPVLIEKVDGPITAELFVQKMLAKWLVQEEYAFGIWEPEGATLIGYVHFRQLDWHLPQADLSYFIDESYAGQGLMTEVLSRMVQFAFRELQLNRLTITTLVDNVGSQRVARKLGFRREGDLRCAYRRESGALVDVMLFALTREEYGE